MHCTNYPTIYFSILKSLLYLQNILNKEYGIYDCQIQIGITEDIPFYNAVDDNENTFLYYIWIFVFVSKKINMYNVHIEYTF